MGAPPPTTAPAPSPAPGHPGHHLHHPGHHSHHPSRHLHHPGPQEGGGGQVDPGQIPGLQVSQDSIFHLPFAPLSNPPPGHPRGTWTPRTRSSSPAPPHPSLMPLASLPISSWPTSLRTKDLWTKDSLEGYLLKALEDATRWPILLTSSSPPPPPPLLQVHRLVSTKDRLQGFLLKALEEVSRWPSLLTFSSSSSSPPPPPPPPPLPSTHPPRPLINCFPPDRSLLVLASREGEEVVIPALAALARTRCGIISLFSKCDL